MHPFSSIRHSLIVVGVLGATGLAALGQTKSAPGENVVDLPPLMVKEPAIPLRWRYIELPGLELVSVCSDRSTAAFLRRHHVQSQLVSWLIPNQYLAKSSVPDAYVLFNEEISRARSEEIVAELMKKPAVSGKRDTGNTDESDDTRFGLPRMQTRYRFLPNMRLTDPDFTAVFVILRESDQHATEFAFTADRVAHLLQNRQPALPPWCWAGLVGLYSQASFDDDSVFVRPLEWWSRAETEALREDDDRPRVLLSMQEVLEVGLARRTLGNTTLNRLWQMQVTLFARWALATNKPARQAAYWRLVDRLENEPLSESLFESCFGLGYSDMRDTLSDFLTAAVRERTAIKGPKLERPPAFKFRDATPGEVARIRGDWERLEIKYVRSKHPELTSKYVEQARRTLRPAYDRGDRDPRLMAVMGLTECDADNRAAAKPFLEAAAAGKVARPRAYLELSLLCYAEEAAAAENRKLEAAQVDRVMGPLWTAHAQHPALPAVYMLMADIWTKSATALGGEELDVLSAAAKLFPHLPSLTLKVAYLNAVNGRIPQASSQLATGLRNTADPATKQLFENAQAQLEEAVRRKKS